MRFKHYISEEMDCDGKPDNMKSACIINNLNKEIADLKKQKRETDDPEKKQDLDYQIDSLADAIDAEMEKADSADDLEKTKED